MPERRIEDEYHRQVRTDTSDGELYHERNLVILSRLPLLVHGDEMIRHGDRPRPAYQRVTAVPPTSTPCWPESRGRFRCSSPPVNPIHERGARARIGVGRHSRDYAGAISRTMAARPPIHVMGSAAPTARFRVAQKHIRGMSVIPHTTGNVECHGPAW